jgi:hypothetical protein
MAIRQKEVMELIRGGQKAEEESPTLPPSEQGADTPPMASPMSTPEPKKGEEERARLNVLMALDLLQQSMSFFDPKSREASAIESALTDLTRSFGEREQSLRQMMPAEIIQMIETLPQAGGATPGQREALLAPIAGTQAAPLPF